jgi:tubulysin polyketide synthase-like protein
VVTAAALLGDLQRRGVRLEAHGGKLRAEAPRGELTDADKALIAAHKADLLALLKDRPTPKVAARLTAFRNQLAAWRTTGRPGWPVFTLPDVPPQPGEVVACVSCAAPLQTPTPGRW